MLSFSSFAAYQIDCQPKSLYPAIRAVVVPALVVKIKLPPTLRHPGLYSVMASTATHEDSA